jgi:hypothetical protein
MDGFDVHAADFKGEVAENRDLARRRELPEPRRRARREFLSDAEHPASRTLKAMVLDTLPLAQ